MEENQVYIPDGWHLKQVQEFAVKMRSGVHLKVITLIITMVKFPLLQLMI